MLSGPPKITLNPGITQFSPEITLEHQESAGSKVRAKKEATESGKADLLGSTNNKGTEV